LISQFDLSNDEAILNIDTGGSLPIALAQNHISSINMYKSQSIMNAEFEYYNSHKNDIRLESFDSATSTPYLKLVYKNKI
jgi:hypothetical protein